MDDKPTKVGFPRNITVCSQPAGVTLVGSLLVVAPATTLVETATANVLSLGNTATSVW